MTTTSLKLPDELKQRAAAVALELGVTPHAFMVDAIRKAAAAAEKHAEFVAQAKAARKKMLKTGTGYDASEAHAYLRRRLAASASETSSVPAELSPPKAKPWRG